MPETAGEVKSLTVANEIPLEEDIPHGIAHEFSIEPQTVSVVTREIQIEVEAIEMTVDEILALEQEVL